MLFPTAPSCLHSEHRLELQKTGQHYAQKRCKQCDRFLGWLSKPQSQQMRAETLTKVERLWNASPSPEERDFLLGVAAADGRMSGREEGRLNGLWARHLVSGELSAWAESSSSPPPAGRTGPSPLRRL